MQNQRWNFWKTFEIEKMHVHDEEIEAQNCAKLLKLAISLEEKIDLSEIQNAANTKIHFMNSICD